MQQMFQGESGAGSGVLADFTMVSGKTPCLRFCLPCVLNSNSCDHDKKVVAHLISRA